jgi:hypothetical protein
MADTRYAFVLTEWRTSGGSSIGWSSTIKVTEMAGPLDELRGRLRPWALETIASERLDNGKFTAHLVDLDDDGEFDLYLAEDIEDVFWFYGTEYVPAS